MAESVLAVGASNFCSSTAVVSRNESANIKMRVLSVCAAAVCGEQSIASMINRIVNMLRDVFMPLVCRAAR